MAKTNSKEKAVIDFLKKKYPNWSDAQIRSAMSKLSPTELLGKKSNNPLKLDTGLGKNTLDKPVIFNPTAEKPKSQRSQRQPNTNNPVIDPFEASLDKSMKFGRAIEMGKLGVNLARYARNESTKAPDPITPGRVPLLKSRDISPDFSEIDQGLKTSMAQVRAAGLGSSHLNALFRNSMKAKNQLATTTNAQNTANKMNIDKANAGIIGNNENAMYAAKRANQQVNLQLGAAKGAAQTALMGSIFDNATNYYNYGVEKQNKMMQKAYYEKMSNPYLNQ